MATWEAMVQSGELTKDALKDLVRQPWLSMEVNDVEGFEGAVEAKELLRTPAQRREALGLDKFLTSQKADPGRQKRRQTGRKVRADARAAARKGTLGGIRKLKDEGYSLAQAFEMSVTPKVGSKSAPKKKLTLSESRNAKVLKALAKKRARDRGKAAAQAQAAEDEEAVQQQSLEAAWQDSCFLRHITGGP